VFTIIGKCDELKIFRKYSVFLSEVLASAGNSVRPEFHRSSRRPRREIDRPPGSRGGFPSMLPDRSSSYRDDGQGRRTTGKGLAAGARPRSYYQLRNRPRCGRVHQDPWAAMSGPKHRRRGT